MRIEKKIWPQYFDKVASGEKNFEVRLADFKCKAGDVLVLKEWDPKKKRYTGRSMEKYVKYVAKTKGMKFYKPAEIAKFGLQVIGLGDE
ncbi:MAG: DUF3850 domain-containing protein [Candidatus Micrarchaeota archaeon]|nr:DUF3850 domain-containing protein [Candidatus Micrarchaeota archaeon]